MWDVKGMVYTQSIHADGGQYLASTLLSRPRFCNRLRLMIISLACMALVTSSIGSAWHAKMPVANAELLATEHAVCRGLTGTQHVTQHERK
jgi:hypothetical protein